MTAKKLAAETQVPVQNDNGGTVIVLDLHNCQSCEDRFSCEQAFRNCRACVTMPELFVSQR